MDTIAASLGADVHDGVADSVSLALLDVFMVDQPDTHGIDEGIPFIGSVELHFTPDRRDADAVPVAGDPCHYFFK